MRIRSLWLVYLAFLITMPHPAIAAQPEFVALRITHPIAMSGRLDDPTWQQAEPVSAFFEVYPDALAPSPYPTTVRILYDDNYLYVGIEADDPKPELIRGHFVRRDHIYSPNSDDHLHLYLDALDTGRSAQMFAVNIRNDQLDGFWNEDNQSEDYTSDFNWDSATARTANGWSAIMRIPFSSLRFRPGRRQTWKLIVWRGVIRDNFYQEASTRIPNGANCLMCYAGNLVLDDFPSNPVHQSVSLTPEITFTHDANNGDFGTDSHNHMNLGGYLSWQPHAGTVVDGMWNPDFSQVESDDFQPTANNQFALLYPEKRPFFLESNNLLKAPIQAIYTRSIGEPRWGLRLTQQMDGGNYTLLASQDQGGGSLIEPGLLSSSLVPQPGNSTATLGRFQQFGDSWRLGGLFTYQRYDDGSHNLVIGPDLLWTPSDADRVQVQYLYSTTEDPNRPDLFSLWQGQSFDDHAAYLDWSHGTATWAWETTYQYLGDGFRTWEGFVPQVGVKQFDANLGYNFYPAAGGWINNITPQLSLTHTDDEQNNTVLRSFAPSLIFNGTQSSYGMLSWYPDDRQLTSAGLVHLRYGTLTFSSNPSARFTYLSGTLRVGENVDYLTGDKGYGPQLRVMLQAYPVDRLELDLVDSYQRLNADMPLSSESQLFNERGTQLRTLWYFTNHIYTELSMERDIIHRNQANYASAVNSVEKNTLFSLLFAYEPTPWTHFYAGYRKSSAQTINQPIFDGDQAQIFIKMAYEFGL